MDCSLPGSSAHGLFQARARAFQRRKGHLAHWVDYSGDPFPQREAGEAFLNVYQEKALIPQFIVIHTVKEQKIPKCSTWMQSQKRLKDLC